MNLDLGFKTGGEAAGGQFTGWIIAYDRGFLEEVGHLDYTLLNDEYYLDHIEVAKPFRHKGVARQLLETFMETEGVPYERIHWAVTDGCGRHVKKHMDKHLLDKQEEPSLPPRSITYRGKTYHRMVYDAEDPVS